MWRSRVCASRAERKETDKIQPLTNSEMSQFLNCRRGWYLTYYLQLRRVHDLPSLPSIGSMYHDALEKYYLACMATADPQNPAEDVRAYADELAVKHPELEEQIRSDAQWAAIMAEGYVEWVEETGADVGYKIIGAEEAVEVDLKGTPFRLRGKIDARLEREIDGALLQLEHKTTGDLVTIPKYAQNAPQFLTYDLLAFLKAKDEGGRATDGVIVNMARRVKRTVRAKPPFYARHEVRHNVHELRAHWRHVVAIGYEIEEVRRMLDEGTEHHDVCPPRIDRNHVWSCACQPVSAVMDDGSDWQEYVAEFYEPHDPWARYAAEGGG